MCTAFGTTDSPVDFLTNLNRREGTRKESPYTSGFPFVVSILEANVQLDSSGSGTASALSREGLLLIATRTNAMEIKVLVFIFVGQRTRRRVPLCARRPFLDFHC